MLTKLTDWVRSTYYYRGYTEADNVRDMLAAAAASPIRCDCGATATVRIGLDTHQCALCYYGAGGPECVGCGETDPSELITVNLPGSATYRNQIVCWPCHTGTNW